MVGAAAAGPAGYGGGGGAGGGETTHIRLDARDKEEAAARVARLKAELNQVREGEGLRGRAFNVADGWG